MQTIIEAYRCYNPLTGRIHISRHVVFDELRLQFHTSSKAIHDSASRLYDPWLCANILGDGIQPTTFPAPSNSTHIEAEMSDAQMDSTHIEADMSDTQMADPPLDRFSGLVYSRRTPASTTDFVIVPSHPRRSTRARHPVDRWISYNTFTLDFQLFMTSLHKQTEPKCYSQASQNSRWIEAMNEEMEALNECQTWEVVPRPRDKNVVGSKWVYKIKYKPDGSIDRYKARLVARGFTQQHGEDYDETFSPVVKMSTIRVILSLAVTFGWSLHQLDVKNAFLHGFLKEDVYMEQPPGYATNDSNLWVCKLHKSLYGLKQASRSWFERFSLHIQEAGFQKSALDHSLFIYHKGGITTWLLIYVDDIVLTGNTSSHIVQIKEVLEQHFKMKDLGDLRYFLGVELDRTEDSLTLSQHKYALDILTSSGMSDCKPINTPNVFACKVERFRWQSCISCSNPLPQYC